MEHKSEKDWTPLDVPYEYVDRPMWFHTRGLSETASGYGRRLRSARCVRIPGDPKLRRVYITIYSNIGTAWINYQGVRRIVN